MNFTGLRQQMMTAVNTVNKLIDEKESRELSVVRTELQNAQMFAGKLIGLFNEQEHPYKNDGKRKTKTDIEPMANATDAIFDLFIGGTRTLAIDKFREILKDLKIQSRNYIISPEINNQLSGEVLDFDFMTYSIALQQHIDRARMWLGMELNRMRNE